MVVYKIIFVWSILSYFICKIVSKKNRENCYIVLNYVPMILAAGLRGESVGADTILYRYIFFDIANANILDGFYPLSGVEVGYVFINKIFELIGADVQVVLFIISGFIIISFAWCFKKYSSNIYISTILFIGLGIFGETYNILRQMIAITIIYISFKFLINGNKIKYLLSIVIAICFHTSAIIMLPFVLLIPINKRKVLVGSFVGGLFVLSLYIWGIGPVANLVGLSKYAGYALSEEYGNGKELGVGIFKIIAFGMVCLNGYYFSIKGKFTENEKIKLMWWSVFTVCSCLTFIAQYKILILQRFNWYFTVSFCFLLPLIIEKWNKYCRIVVLILLVFFFWYYMNSFLEGSTYELFD